MGSPRGIVDRDVGVRRRVAVGRLKHALDRGRAEPAPQRADERVVELAERRVRELVADAVDDEHADVGGS